MENTDDWQDLARKAFPPPSSHQLTQSLRQGNRRHQARDAQDMYATPTEPPRPSCATKHDSSGPQEGDIPHSEKLQTVKTNAKIWQPNPITETFLSVISVNYHYVTVLCPFNLLIRFKCYNTV